MKKIISFALVCVMLACAVFTLSSCGKPDSDPKEAAAALEEEGYEVTVNETPKDCKTYIWAWYNNVNEKTSEHIEIFYYENEDAAKAAWEEKSKEYEKTVAAQDKDYKCEYGIDGALIYYGTKAAIKAAK